jgi:hypothetical protein
LGIEEQKEVPNVETSEWEDEGGWKGHFKSTSKSEKGEEPYEK